MENEQVQEQAAENQPDFSTQMQQAIWEDKPLPTPAQSQQEPPKIEPPKVEDEEILDPKDWLKRELEVDDIAIIKQEREEYKKLKEAAQTPAEIKFADEQSKHIHELIREGKGKWKEVRQFLETQEKLETYSSVEVNKDTAADIIKLGMQLKYKDLTPKEIDYKYNKQFSIPKEPVQSATETDQEFAGRVDEWNQRVSDIEAERIIEAKLMRPELDKAKSELVLPDISKKEAPQKQGPTQEELAAFDKDKAAFLKSYESVLNEFNGFNVSVKDKDVDFTVNYAPSKEEKELVGTKLKEFAESGFDANALLAHRWVNEDRTLNVNQMVKDLQRIYADDKVSQKLVTDAANQRLELYLKDKKRININEVRQEGTFVPDGEKTPAQKLQEQFWNN